MYQYTAGFGDADQKGATPALCFKSSCQKSSQRGCCTCGSRGHAWHEFITNRSQGAPKPCCMLKPTHLSALPAQHPHGNCQGLPTSYQCFLCPCSHMARRGSSWSSTWLTVHYRLPLICCPQDRRPEVKTSQLTAVTQASIGRGKSLRTIKLTQVGSGSLASMSVVHVSERMP